MNSNLSYRVPNGNKLRTSVSKSRSKNSWHKRTNTSTFFPNACCGDFLASLSETMRLLFDVLLYILHFSYSSILKLRSIWEQWSPTHPQPLLAPRRRIPRHLAILFTDSSADTHSSKNALTESILRSIEWCRLTGIKKLTVFEEKGTS